MKGKIKSSFPTITLLAIYLSWIFTTFIYGLGDSPQAIEGCIKVLTVMYWLFFITGCVVISAGFLSIVIDKPVSPTEGILITAISLVFYGLGFFVKDRKSVV